MSTDESPTPRIPDDDPARSLTVVAPDDPETPYIFLAGGTYAILVSGEQTDGRYCLIDMHVPAGGGPPPHRHDFEEMFTILEGEVTFTFRGAEHVVAAGSTVNIPANAPHFFRNDSGSPVRMLCLCTPAGQEEYFLRVGDVIAGRDAPAPDLTPAELEERRSRAAVLAGDYATELLV